MQMVAMKQASKKISNEIKNQMDLEMSSIQAYKAHKQEGVQGYSSFVVCRDTRLTILIMSQLPADCFVPA